MGHETFYDPLPDCHALMTDIYILEKTVDALYAATIETPTSALDLPAEMSKVRQFNSLLYDQIELTKAKLALRRIQLCQHTPFDTEPALSGPEKGEAEENAKELVKDFCTLLKEKIQKL